MVPATTFGNSFFCDRSQDQPFYNAIFQQPIASYDGMISNQPGGCIHHARDDVVHISVNIYNGHSGLKKPIGEIALQLFQCVGDQQIIWIDMPRRAAE